MFAFSDISEPCSGTEYFDELDTVHTFVMTVFIVNMACCCCMISSVICAVMSGGDEIDFSG
jgi:hypothetical protein